MNVENKEQKALLNVKEFCEYLGIKDTKARVLLRDPGNRFYAHKGKLDLWLLNRIM